MARSANYRYLHVGLIAVKPLGRRIIIATVLGAIAVMSAAWAFYTLSLMGVSVYRITTGSMEPDFPVGTIVVNSSLIPLTIGRPLTFTADGKTVTHVLVGYNPDGSLVTRGTANPANDTWVRPVFPGNVRGHVIFRVLLFAPSFWMTPRGWLATGGVVIIVAAAYAIRHRTRTIRL